MLLSPCQVQCCYHPVRYSAVITLSGTVLLSPCQVQCCYHPVRYSAVITLSGTVLLSTKSGIVAPSAYLSLSYFIIVDWSTIVIKVFT